MQQKIVLGTVQLGLTYGINNSLGKPSEAEAFRILDFAHNSGVKLLDSADAYGESLSVIGGFHKATSKYFEVISKFKIDNASITEKLKNCLELTGLPSLYSYMYHDFGDYASGRVMDELVALRDGRLIKKIGVSLYSVDQLKVVVNDSSVDLIQLPVNVFDLSADKMELLRRARISGKEVHARSVFLQGLFLRDPEMLTGNLFSFRPYLEKLNYFTKQMDIDLKKYALNFVLHQQCIDRIILGVERVEQLQENLSLMIDNFDISKCPKIELADQDMYLLNPSNWRL